MSSLPTELLRDVLLSVDRWTLDAAQFTDRRFLQLIMNQMSDVCLRRVKKASLEGPNPWDTNLEDLPWDTSMTSIIHIDGRPERKISDADGDTARLFSDFVQALRSSHVASLSFTFLDFTPAFAALVLETPIFADALNLTVGSSAQLTPARFHEVLLHFSATSVDINSCRVRACHITEGFLKALSKNHVRRIMFQNVAPEEGGRFPVTDDAVVDFCVQEDASVGQKGDPMKWDLHGELVVDKDSFTKSLFRRLIEASAVSMRTQALRITVSPLRFEEKDLREFAQHLSYRYRGEPWQERIYNFPGEQHGAVAAVDLQIVLHVDNMLEMIRARRAHIFFHKSDE